MTTSIDPPDSDDALLPLANGGRDTKQARSTKRQQRIAEAAIVVIAEHGVAGLTHRRVAQQAKVSLAATTYYYQAKRDIVVDATRMLLNSQIDKYRQLAERCERNPKSSFRDVVLQLMINAAGQDNMSARAWCEIILNAARCSIAQTLCQAWFENLKDAWLRIATALGVPDPDRIIMPAIDIVAGLLFTIVPLRLSEAQIRAAFEDGDDPVLAWLPDKLTPPAEVSAETEKLGKKAEDTRERILAAATNILITDGDAALTYRNVALSAGLSPAAPTYHFLSIEELLTAAKKRLLKDSLDQFRRVRDSVNKDTVDGDRLVDIVTAIFLRQATEYGALTLANYPIKLEALRDPAMYQLVRDAVEEHCRNWGVWLDICMPQARGNESIILLGHFSGKMLRILATGARTDDLANVRKEFETDLSLLASGQHWAFLPR